MVMWDPWRGCHKHSAGCLHCYIHKGDAKRGVDTDQVVLTGKMNKPIERFKRGERAGQYKVPAGETVYLCFSSDFLLSEADSWRVECWRIIKERADLSFMFLTKRIERFSACLPPDWGDGYENVTVGCTVEDSQTAQARLPIFDKLPIRHKNIICQPLLEAIEIEAHLDGVELVMVGGESDREARLLDYDWVLSIREQCRRKGVRFDFRQCGSVFRKEGVVYRLNPYQLMTQAKQAKIDLK